jgi:NADH dehydrogenase FAD-containing subunit
LLAAAKCVVVYEPDSMKHLVLLGGGRSHLHVLGELAKAPWPGLRITLVSPSGQPCHAGIVNRWVAGQADLQDGHFPLAEIARRAGAQFTECRAVALDVAKRVVGLTNGQELHYDLLSIDTGGAIDRDAIVGAREHALFLRPLAQFIQFWDAMLMLAEQRLLNVVVIGNGIDAIELALAVQHRLRTRARVALVTHGGPPLPAFPVPVQASARRELRRGGVTLFEDACAVINASQVRLHKGFSLSCDAPLIALEPGVPAWLGASGLALDGQGLVQVDDCLRSSSHPEVFVVGEVSSKLTAGAGVPLAANLRRAAASEALLAAKPAPRWWNFVMGGDGRGIANCGPLTFSGRWAGWWKRLQYQAEVARWRATASRPMPLASEVVRAETEDHR